jgi:hypothetical protein
MKVEIIIKTNLRKFKSIVIIKNFPQLILRGRNRDLIKPQLFGITYEFD